MTSMASVMPPPELTQQTEEDTFARFVAAKTRVAPLQAQTIPRLELLLSALLLSRLITSVSDAFKSTLPQLGLICSTDSQVMGTIRNGSPRIEIRQLVPPNCWSHCSGETNPAGLPSRGLTVPELSVSQLWLNGPEWLGTKLISPDSANMPEECASEMVKSQRTHNLLIPNSKPTIDEVMDCRDYSTVSRLLKVTAYVLKAVKIFKAGSSAFTYSLYRLMKS